MSGMSNRSAVMARQKYGAKIWIERGSTHILCQQRILDALPGSTKVSDESVHREMVDYGNADYVSVLSQHCLESFVEHGVDASRLFCNPLGVDLSVFRPTESPIGDEPTIIMTGNWSYQKGCHWLVEAWKRLPGVRLLHVGKVGDCPLPKEPGFEHYEPVDQNHLIDFYRRAHVFVLASAQDGLATVQPQALACGLRLVCTTRTGGADLRQFVLDSDVISVVDPGDVGSLANAIREQLRVSLLESGVRMRLRDSAKEDLSWGGYARRYDTEIRSKLGLIGSAQSCER
jgi:glycosyltransferase involved in cell wall biosynthesis